MRPGSHVCAEGVVLAGVQQSAGGACGQASQAETNCVGSTSAVYCQWSPAVQHSAALIGGLLSWCCLLQGRNKAVPVWLQVLQHCMQSRQPDVAELAQQAAASLDT